MKIKYRNKLGLLLTNPDSHVVEIGVAEGRFSSEILSWKNTGTLYMVDAWQSLPQRGDGGFPQVWHDNNYDSALSVKSKTNKDVKILRGLSSDMSYRVKNESIDMLYIDGDHSFDGVMTDLAHWFKKVKKGGIVAGHDYLCTDYKVQEALFQFLINNGLSTDIVNTIEEDHVNDAGFWFIKQ